MAAILSKRKSVIKLRATQHPFESAAPGWEACDHFTLLWRHNDHDSVSNHQPHDCLLNRLFRRRSKQTSKLRVIGLCAGNSPGTGEFPAQMASNAENVSIWWRHHDLHGLTLIQAWMSNNLYIIKCGVKLLIPSKLQLCSRWGLGMDK